MNSCAIVFHLLICFVNVYLHKGHNISIEKTKVCKTFLSYYFQIDYAIEVIIIFCYKEKLQKEKESYTEKVHAKGKRFENIFKKLYFS